MADKFTADPKGVTLEDAKKWLRGKVRKGAECPCCTQFAKVYKRKLNASMAVGMIKFYKHTGGAQEWVHIPTHTDLSRLGGDWAKLAKWGLVEERESDRPDGGKHAGWWRITDLGAHFVLGRTRVPQYVFIYNQRLMKGDDDSTVSIHEALGSEFNYNELMNA